MRGILLFLGVVYFSLFSFSQESTREFRFDTEFSSSRPRVVDDWNSGDGKMRVSLIESASAISKSSAKKLLQEFSGQKILLLNLDQRPESRREIEELLLLDERIQQLPDEMGKNLRDELSSYSSERENIVRRHGKHYAAIHFTSSLGAFSLISYLGEDLPHLAHWSVGFAVAWQCWLAQRYLLEINKFIYNISDGFFKSTDVMFSKLGIKTQLSSFAINLENTLNDNLSPHKLFPKKLMVTFFTLVLYCAEWAAFEFQHAWIKELFLIPTGDGSSFLRSLSQLGSLSFWSFVINASLLDLFSEGIPHWAVNNYSKTSRISPTEQARLIYKWSSAISLFVTFTTLGALATDIAIFKWISFPIAITGLSYFIFDGVIRRQDTNNKLRFFLSAKPPPTKSETPTTKPHAPQKRVYSCLIRLSQ